MPAASFVIAVFGGSFNPPHVAHQLAALYVLETQPVDELLVVPTWRHAFDKALAPFADRLEMCRLAMVPLGPRVQVSSIEEELGGQSSRTIVTLEALAARRPDATFRLIIGADILPEREKWWRWSDIERLAPPIVIGRAGHPGGEETIELPPVSSTEIRARLADGRPVSALVPRAVLSYVTGRGLYRP
jgi:nicotinate-nucleotide adenylyltransferase